MLAPLQTRSQTPTTMAACQVIAPLTTMAAGRPALAASLVLLQLLLRVYQATGAAGAGAEVVIIAAGLLGLAADE